MNILCALIIITFITNCIVSHKLLYVKTPIDIPVIFFVLAKLISVFTSISPESSSIILINDLPYYLLFFIFNYILSEDFEKIYQNFLRVLLFSSLIGSLIGIASYLLKFSERAISTTSGFTTLGIYLTVCLSIFLFQQDNKYLFRNNILFFVFILILLGGILFTFNRTHWLACILIIIVYSVYKRKYIYILFTVISSAVFIFIPSLQVRLFQLILFWKNMSDRDILWKGAYSLIYEKPFFGFGPNTFNIVFPLKNELADKMVASWHNDYLQIYMDSGIFAITAFVLIIIFVYYYAYKYLKSDYDKKNKIIPILCALSFFFIFGGFLDYLGSLLFKIILSIFIIQISLFYKQKKTVI